VADTGAMVVFAQHTISLIVRTNAGRGFSALFGINNYRIQSS
jgi:hypothetical protein